MAAAITPFVLGRQGEPKAERRSVFFLTARYRDGTIVRAVDPAKYAAWSQGQGDVASPNTKVPTIAAAVASAAAVIRRSRIPTAAKAGPYLEELPVLWTTTSDAGRHAIAEAVFERIPRPC